MDSDQADSGDKNIAIKIAAAGAAVVVGLGALYLLTRSDPKKSKKKSKKDKERSKSKKDKKKKKADSEDEEDDDGQERIDWENRASGGAKPAAGARKAFDPNAHGIKQEILELEEAREWMESFHETKDYKSTYAALVALLSDLSADAASVQDSDKAGVMRSDYERWFLTGFIAGVLATNPAMCIPQSLMVLRRMGAKKEDLSEAPMVLYAAMLCSRTKEAMSTAFELWMSSQSEASMKGVKNEQQITKMFEKALTEFSEMTMSYMPLILMGTYYATRKEAIIQQAMTTLERFFEALRKARVQEQIEGFYRGTAYALTRFAALGPDFKTFLADFKTDDPTLKKAIREALTGANGGNDFDDVVEEEAPPKRSMAGAKMRSAGGARAGRTAVPEPDPADE